MLNLDHQEHGRPERGWWLHDPASDRKAFGFVLHASGNGWKIARSLIGSPAEKVGIKSGDVLTHIDGFQLGSTTGEMHELHLLLGLSKDLDHKLKFASGSSLDEVKVQKADLRSLLEHDFDNGGALLGSCVGCRTCRPVTIGATDCSSGCPGNYCTIG